MARYRVAPATQVNHDGRVYGPGEAFEATEEEVAHALKASWVAPTRTKAVKADEVDDKAVTPTA